MAVVITARQCAKEYGEIFQLFDEEVREKVKEFETIFDGADSVVVTSDDLSDLSEGRSPWTETYIVSAGEYDAIAYLFMQATR